MLQEVLIDIVILIRRKSISLQPHFSLKMNIPLYLMDWCQSEEPMLCALAMRLRFQSVPLMELMEMRLVLMRMMSLLRV